MITVVVYHQEVYLNTIFSDVAMLTVIGAGGSDAMNCSEAASPTPQPQT